MLHIYYAIFKIYNIYHTSWLRIPTGFGDIEVHDLDKLVDIKGPSPKKIFDTIKIYL